MRNKTKGLYTAIAIVCGFTHMSYASQSKTPFTQHGLVQNVQNYSSNPFWNPNAPYNQRMPTAVYAQGTDVKTSECQGLATALVEQQCALRDNCSNIQLSDIRPAMIIQMSQLPGGNYSTACAGYLDTAFENYKKTHTAVNINIPTAFPSATVANPNMVSTKSLMDTKSQMPEWMSDTMARQTNLQALQMAKGTVAQPDTGTPKKQNSQIPGWMADTMARQAELQALQQQTSGTVVPIEQTDFPTTYADLSFTERMKNEQVGYEPYKDKSAYTQIEIESEEKYLMRQKEIQEAKQKIQKSRDLLALSLEDFCKKYPSEAQCKDQAKEKIDREAMMTKIAEALKEAKK